MERSPHCIWADDPLHPRLVLTSSALVLPPGILALTVTLASGSLTVLLEILFVAENTRNVSSYWQRVGSTSQH
jgi:hypothetical protein